MEGGKFLGDPKLMDQLNKIEKEMKMVSNLQYVSGEKKTELLTDLQSAFDQVIGGISEVFEKIPELETENFHIDSSHWKETVDKNGIKFKENSEGDVVEYLEGTYAGQQFFTDDAALRETKKSDKKLPPPFYYQDLIHRKYGGNFENFVAKENIKFCGYFGSFHRRFEDIDNAIILRGNKGFIFDCHKNGLIDHYFGNKLGLYSVRCLKN